MAVIRVNKTTDYTVMSNHHLKDKRLSLKAKGLLSIMLSLSDEWRYSIAGLVAISKENETAIKSTLTELKKFGYLIVTKKMPNETNSGRIEYEYNIYEQPQAVQAEEKQGVENLPVENQGVENHGQLNTNISNTKELNTKVLNTKNISAEFEELWKQYPRKVGKPKALKAYEKARKNGTTFEQVKQGIENYCNQIKAKNTETQYIQHGSTWFGNEGWHNEYDFTPVRQPKQEQQIVYQDGGEYYFKNGAKFFRIDGKEYICKNGKYFIPNGSGVAVNPFAKDDLPF